MARRPDEDQNMDGADEQAAPAGVRLLQELEAENALLREEVQRHLEVDLGLAHPDKPAG